MTAKTQVTTTSRISADDTGMRAARVASLSAATLSVCAVAVLMLKCTYCPEGWRIRAGKGSLAFKVMIKTHLCACGH